LASKFVRAQKSAGERGFLSPYFLAYNLDQELAADLPLEANGIPTRKAQFAGTTQSKQLRRA
jgi:hypothetical protein